MKHDEVVAALRVIADNEKAPGINKNDLDELRLYNLIINTEAEASKKSTIYALTKKGRVMLKANSKQK